MDLLILQHPSETGHAINTARIAALGINNCTILTGEDFSDSAVLEQQLAQRTACLLFPCAEATPVCDYMATHSRPELCVILDGTWRKAKKIYFLNSVLHQLPALALTGRSPSTYTIRKAPAADALSTIEATVTFLREASQNSDCHQNCLDAFATMIDFQIVAMGAATFARNYAKKS